MIVTVANQKGGVGKTTTVVRTLRLRSPTWAERARGGSRPQGNATTGLGVSNRTDNPGSMTC
ncbi:MAG: ParA family protein [Candidatus Nanopelagicales bacterium]